MATNFMLEIGEIGLLTFNFNAPDARGVPNGLKYRNSVFKRFIAMIWLHQVKIW